MTIPCETCGELIEASRRGRRFCSDRCRKAAKRAQPAPRSTQPRSRLAEPLSAGDDGTVDRVADLLEQRRRLWSMLDEASATTAAALSKELRAINFELQVIKDERQAEPSLAEALRERRERRLSGGGRGEGSVGW